MSNGTAKKALGILSKMFSWIIFTAVILVMAFTIFSALTFDRNDRHLFGIRFYIVLSDSMSPSENNKNDEIHFSAGDVVLIKMAEDPAALPPGEVIAFVSHNSDSLGETLTHKIRSVEKTKDGTVLGYVTYGTHTGANDEALVEPDYVLGTYTGKLPFVGRFFTFFKTVPGYFLCVLLPFLLLILWLGLCTARLFKRYKAEQMAEIESERERLAKEREQLAKEREQAERLFQEIQELKAQLTERSRFLNQQSSSAAAPTAKKTAKPKGLLSRLPFRPRQK